MVAQFLGLKLRLLGNAYSRRSWPLFGVIMLTLGLILLTGLLAERVTTLRLLDPQQIGWILTLGGSAAVVLLALVPLLAGRDDPLDPRRFSFYGIPPRRLAFLLASAGILAVPLLMVAVLALATALAWFSSVGLAIVGLIAAAIAYLTCLLVSRISTAIGAFLFSDARSRDTASVLTVLVLAVVAGLVILLLGLDWQEEGPAFVTGTAAVLGWTPLGAAWSLPSELAQGNVLAFVGKLIISLGTILLLWLAWRTLVLRMLRSERQERAYVRQEDALGWFARFPSNPAGTIAARSLTYWARDPRYFVALIPVPILPFLMFLPLAIVGVPMEYLALIPLPVTCLFLGWAIHNDIAYDNTAIWLHIVSGPIGVADRIGRMTPPLVFGIPLIAIGSVVSAYFAGNWDTLPALIGVSTCLLFSGLGLGAFTSSLFQYPAVRPGDAPFEQPQAAGATPALVQTGTFVGVVALTATPATFAILGLMGDRDGLWAALWIGLGIGILVLVAGTWTGGRIFNKRGPEILAQALRN